LRNNPNWRQRCRLNRRHRRWLHLSPTTVGTYPSNAIAKVRARYRVEAIRIARNAGWV
jgi:hypothetical protein